MNEVCYFSGKNVLGADRTTKCTPIASPADHFCYGCDQIICENHDYWMLDFGDADDHHTPLDHLGNDTEGV